MIRLATETDAQAVADIFNENIDDRGFAHCELNPEPAEAWAAILSTAGPRYPTFVHVDAGGEILGWCALKPLTLRPTWPDVAEIALYVTRSSRHGVVGARLLVQLLDAARLREFRWLIAVVLERNTPSLRGLGIAGFGPVARLHEAALLYGERLDVLWLQKTLAAEQPSIAQRAARFRGPASAGPGSNSARRARSA